LDEPTRDRGSPQRRFEDGWPCVAFPSMVTVGLFLGRVLREIAAGASGNPARWRPSLQPTQTVISSWPKRDRKQRSLRELLQKHLRSHQTTTRMSRPTPAFALTGRHPETSCSLAILSGSGSPSQLSPMSSLEAIWLLLAQKPIRDIPPAASAITDQVTDELPFEWRTP